MTTRNTNQLPNIGTRDLINKTSFTVGNIAAGFAGVAMIAYIIGGLLLSGGEMHADDTRKWGTLIPYPIFIYPDWLTVTIAAIAIPAFLIQAITVTPATIPGMLFSYRIGSAGLFLAPFLFLLVYTEDPNWTSPTAFALYAGIATLALMVAISARHFKAADALARKRLTEGFPRPEQPMNPQ